MSEPATSFDRLARIYRALEFLAFGRDLERARYCFLDELATCRDILVLGEGDGRCLARLVRAAPAARIHCVDASAAMLACAARRLTDPATRGRVELQQVDIFQAEFPPDSYDAVTTMFFLDCFTTDQVNTIVARVSAALRPDAQWLFADFALPPRGFARLRARIWLTVLYAFFRWQTRLPARVLPPAEAALVRAGFQLQRGRSFQSGLVRTALFARSRSNAGHNTAVPLG
jgi:ubiquinone/menaquinone biosynthesis C-methylase UbiE